MGAPLHTGSCLCGGVRFEVTGALAGIQVCHCSQCRKAQGGAFVAIIPVDRAALHIKTGAELLHHYESTPGKRRVFCSVCASPLYSERESLPGVVRLRVGTLDEPVLAALESHAFVASRAGWWPLADDGVPRHAGALPPAAARATTPLPEAS